MKGTCVQTHHSPMNEASSNRSQTGPHVRSETATSRMVSFCARRTGALLLAVMVSMPAGLLGCGSTDLVNAAPATIIDDPFCVEGGGTFNLLAPGGAVLLVYIGKSTTIRLADGSTGACTDLRREMTVFVRGTIDGQTLTAEKIRIQ
jgi:hypothetical protein